MKTCIKEATILSVYYFHNNEKILLGQMIFGLCIKDDTNRFEPNFPIITSTIKSQNNLEFITKSGSFYLIDTDPEQLEITFAEFVVMRHKLYSPDEILQMRQALRLSDDRIIH
jgi:hypothetical protein